MINEDLLLQAANQLMMECAGTFKIVVVDHERAGRMLAEMLTRAHAASRQDITLLGFASSDEQNEVALRRGTPIVIIPDEILGHRPCRFHPPADAPEVALIEIVSGDFRVSHMECDGQPFEIARHHA